MPSIENRSSPEHKSGRSTMREAATNHRAWRLVFVYPSFFLLSPLAENSILDRMTSVQPEDLSAPIIGNIDALSVVALQALPSGDAA
ncbi:hypothetical protein [Sphingomonas sp. Y38-1Y]|uniref:hypothetical protein n=1 Tax=Sphingomonas sp. Y38-1Y TaxID=3078265 RepID=UPI0028F04A45|nr:hypothetical protein [Sphingomonas sp. Y38-1Y]